MNQKHNQVTFRGLSNLLPVADPDLTGGGGGGACRGSSLDPPLLSFFLIQSIFISLFSRYSVSLFTNTLFSA